MYAEKKVKSLRPKTLKLIIAWITNHNKITKRFKK